jgi:hypothetical protein
VQKGRQSESFCTQLVAARSAQDLYFEWRGRRDSNSPVGGGNEDHNGLSARLTTESRLEIPARRALVRGSVDVVIVWRGLRRIGKNKDQAPEFAPRIGPIRVSGGRCADRARSAPNQSDSGSLHSAVRATTSPLHCSSKSNDVLFFAESMLMNKCYLGCIQTRAKIRQ